MAASRRPQIAHRRPDSCPSPAAPPVLSWGSALCAVLLTAVPAVASQYLIQDLATPRQVDYLVVTAPDFTHDCDALLSHRAAQGLNVGVVSLEAACRHVGSRMPSADALAAFLRGVHEAWSTRYVLLVGSPRPLGGAHLPMRVEAAKYYSDQFPSHKDLATDWYYGAPVDDAPRMHVGRFPATTRSELAAMVAKTLHYETVLPSGPWQRRISLLASPVGLGPVVDAMIQALFTRLVAEDLPAEYEVEVAYADPLSPFCPYPPAFHNHAVREINDGCLFLVYAGHATRAGCDDVRWRGAAYPILDSTQLSHISVSAGPPIMFLIACSTGYLDSPEGPCLAEGLLALPGGPVAVVAASRICQPYGNALLGQGLVEALSSTDNQRLGEALDQARRSVLSDVSSPIRQQADALAAALQGPQALEGMRADTVRHYNLLGDPALLMRRPRPMQVRAQVVEGGQIEVTGEVPLATGTVLVSVECPRTSFTGPLPTVPPVEDPDFAAAMNRRFRYANDKAYERIETPVQEGAFTVRLRLPAATGQVVIKAFAWQGGEAAMGAAHLTVQP